MYVIDIPPESPIEAVAFSALVTRDDKPAPGASVRFSIQGDGTFDAFSEQQTIMVVSSDDGYAFATWWEYPRHAPRRSLKSAVTASCSDASVKLHLEVWSRVERSELEQSQVNLP